jgi:hypothetical protein
MAIPSTLPCDGCGQLVSAEHIARRLQRLEWATRFRPIHVQALLLSAAGPESDAEFLYNPDAEFAGLSGQILVALGITKAAKSPEEVLAEFQKRGLVLASVLECPVEPDTHGSALSGLLERHLPIALTRIRRSLKPKRVLVVSPELHGFLAQLSEPALACPVYYTLLASAVGAPSIQSEEVVAFRAALPTFVANAT